MTDFFRSLCTCRVDGVRAAVAWVALVATVGTAQTTITQTFSLAACEAYATTNAYALQHQRLATANSEFDTVIAWQEFAPRLNAQIGHFRADGKTIDSGSLGLSQPLPFGVSVGAGGSATDDDDAAWSAAISKRLWGAGSWSGSMAAVWNSRLREQVAAHLEELTRRDLIEAVRRNYYDIIRKRQTLVSSRLRVQQARRNLELAQAREEPLDIATAQVEVPQSEAQVLSGEREVLSAIDLLKETLGMPLQTPFEIDETLPFATVTLDAAADVRWCLDHHESLVNRRLAIRAIRNDLTRLHEDVGPTVTLSGEVAGAENNGVDAPTEKRITLRAEWPVGNRAERSRLAIKRNELEDARLGLRQEEIRLQRIVIDLARRLDELKRQVAIDHARMDLMQTRMRIYQDRWENGEIDIVEYIRSQNSVEDARVTLINDQMNYLDVLARFRNLTDRDRRLAQEDGLSAVPRPANDVPPAVR